MALDTHAIGAQQQLDTHGDVNVVDKSTTAGWDKAKAVLANIKVAQAFHTLRDMNTDAYIDPSCLTKIKEIGEGAYATVHQAWYAKDAYQLPGLCSCASTALAHC